MKILHIGKYYPPFHGGMENFLDDLAREQAGLGHEVKVLCHHHEKGLPCEADQVLPGLEIIRVKTIGVLAYAPMAPGFIKTLSGLLRKFQPDVIHAHMPNLSAFWLLFSRAPVKMIIHWHSDVVSSENDWKLRMLYPFYRVFEKRILERAHRIIATSEAYLETSAALQAFREKCRVIPLGVSLDKLRHFAGEFDDRVDPERINDHSIAGQDFILSVGRFTYYKGYEYLVRACKAGYQGRLVIVGDGPLKPGLMGLVRKLGLEKRVFMPGMVDDDHLHGLFARCTAFCLPSIERTEAFGMVLLEAMFHAKPLITTRVEGSGMNEVNVHEETGLAVSPKDPADLARAMNFMLEQKQKAGRMGEYGRGRLEERFDICRVAREIEKVY